MPSAPGNDDQNCKDELAELMGGQETCFNAKGNPAIILIAGLQ